MNLFKHLRLLTLLVIPLCAQAEASKTLINDGWKFKKLEKPSSEAAFSGVDIDDANWEKVSLPHTANIEPLVVNDQWQGICWYRKDLTVPSEAKGKTVILEFEGAMSQCKIWLNGELIKERMGGYLPVVVDVSDRIKAGELNVLAVQLDSRDNPLTGPKPLARLDFNTYGGLYRNVWLTVKEKVYISHPIIADKVAGGGVFITCPKVSVEESAVRVKTHVVNDESASKSVEVVQSIYYGGKLIVEQTSKPAAIEAGKDVEIIETFNIAAAKLWSPDHPNLYSLKTSVKVDGNVVDSETTRFGIREFEFKGHELFVNGKKTYLRGVNRHQEYPFIGYALSDNAQYRDAKKIKEAGFNHIRLSHYPHSVAFMDACDELGLITLDAIMGWQYYLDDDRFRKYCYRSATELIRRDRNRASVLAWEVSLNETKMPIPFMEELHRITHAEYPGKNVYSAGWMNEVYDIFGQARQHRILHTYHENRAKPYFVSEYGDWEYYSNNAGLNQDKLDKSRRYETSSRQRRAYGEKRLLQQAYNLQESYNDNLDTSAYGDAYWVMYDYNRGYHKDIEYSGIMDIFRLPKFSYYFYQSQRAPSDEVVLKIASYWTPKSSTEVKVYSNCDEVKLYLNDQLVSSQKPDSDKNTTNLAHPPFTFKIAAFKPGELRAEGLIDGKKVGQHVVNTPGKATQLKLWLDESGKAAQAGVNDTVFLYIAAVDGKGTVVPDFSGEISLKLDGDVKVMNVGAIEAEAGIATALIQVGDSTKVLGFNATTSGLEEGLLEVSVKE